MDENQSGRCEKTGRFRKGFSGRSLAKRQKKDPTEPMLPHEIAAAILRAGSQLIEVKDRDGRKRRLPAYDVVMHQLAAAAAKGDKPSTRLFTNALTEAAKTLHAYTQSQFDRLGAYLRSVDDGAPWRLDEAEAAFYQQLADQAGIQITIKAYDPNARPEPVSAEEIDAVLSDLKIQTLLRSGKIGRDKEVERGLVRRVLQADRARRAAGLQR